MKRTLLTNLVIAVFSILCTQSCKKKSSSDDNTTTPPTTTVICDGNGSSDYYPLAQSNSWYYTDGGTNSFTNSISGTSVYSSNTYLVVNSTLGGTQYLRKATSGDVMSYSTSNSAEYLFIPASPTVGQSWTYNLEFAATRKVISTNASFTTSSCSYTGLLKLQNFGSDGSAMSVFYYKKGVGMISTDQIWSGYVVTNLKTVSLH